MADQVDELSAMGIGRIGSISSDDNAEDRERILREFSQGKYQLIYISPERFRSKAFRSSFASAVIDEIHCLSEWGHDFRTSHLNLVKTIRKLCPQARFIGLTATASLNVLTDLKIELGSLDENVKTLVGFSREELEFQILKRSPSSSTELIPVLQGLQDRHGIFESKGKDSRCALAFTQTVNGLRGCGEISSMPTSHFRQEVGCFCGSAPKVARFTDGNTFEKCKRAKQESFKKNDMTVLVATKAFGMG